jgi:ATP-dependent Lon protease
MSDKNSNVLIIKKDNITKNEDVVVLVEKKLDFFKDVMQKTILRVHQNKFYDILGVSDVSICIDKLAEISVKINELSEINLVTTNTDTLINNLQIINNEFSSLFKSFGTENLEDLILICFGNNKIINPDLDTAKFELLKKYFHPTSYKVINKKDESTNKQPKKKSSDDDIIDDKTNNLQCFDVMSNYKQFHMKIHGIKLYIYNSLLKKGLLIYGIVDDVIINFLNNKFILSKKTEITENVPSNVEFEPDCLEKFTSSLILKDYLIYNTYTEIYNKFAGCLSQIKNVKQKAISQIVKEFISDDLFSKRNTLINLLINSNNCENQYLAYLLYDLLSSDTNGSVDTQEQTMLFDSLPLSIKNHFRNAMKKTIQYTNDLSNFDINKIPLEQQICLLKAPDNVKEKAMMRLKEVKAKSEDSGSKARQYLDGLLKIPFNVYKREPILNLMGTIRGQFKNIYTNYEIFKILPSIPVKEKYTNIEILKYMKQIKEQMCGNIYDANYINKMKMLITNGDRNTLITNITQINDALSVSKVNLVKIKHSNKKKDELKSEIEKFIDMCHNENKQVLPIIDKLFTHLKLPCSPKSSSTNINKEIDVINNNLSEITDYMSQVKKTLDAAVYGHTKAKRQIERIIAQWINTNSNNVGHVLGFEGNPGIGKTTLAKGLSNCLKDENGVSRPFSLIAIGGDSNSSSLVGHSYTYVGSTWGQIVQILIDKKCMNPIILIDEVDKISRTEHGKEITGILTHLLDPTQNETFQDKYFSGIELDLSKALFILSYNDVDAIDRILLDRVHRIKFDSLSIEDKIVICNTHLLPEIYKKVGLEGMIHFSDETIKFIIEEYTLEPGVRKLKEKIFEIVGEVNLSILQHTDTEYELPIKITIEDIKNNYFKDKREVKIAKIHDESKVGVINALWANELSQGGVLPLQVSFIPSNKFLDLTLTGSLGDVMKESISVSLTTAWNLLTPLKQKELIEKYNNKNTNEIYGLHVNCPSISTKKDGPSATTAFTVAIYSLFNNIKIKNHFGITGETSFDYCLTEIGGLREKIIHSIPAGITEFIYPQENQRDFAKIMEKYKDTELIKGIKFHSLSTIQEVLELILEKN